MSGCVHCVWDDYRDEVEEWAMRLKTAQAKANAAGKGSLDLRKSGKIPQGGRREVERASTSMDDDGGGRESNWDFGSSEAGDLFGSIPVGIREFMKTEKRLRDMHRQEAGRATT